MYFSLENENKHLKDLIQKEHINSNLLLDELKKLRSSHETFIGTNEILIKSNKSLQEKNRKLSTSLEFYRVYFYEYMDLLKQKGKQRRSLSLVHKGGVGAKDVHRFSPEMIKSSHDIVKEENKEVNVSILEEDKEKSKQKSHKMIPLRKLLSEVDYDDHENVNYKVYLLDLAKELYTNPNVRSFFSVNKDLLKKMEIQNFSLHDYKYVIKHSKTLSNPLLYISDSLKGQLQQPPLKMKRNRVSSNNIKIKKIMKSKVLSPMRSFNPADMKGGLLPLFNLDVSKIGGPMDMELSFDAKINEDGIFFLG